uniref:Uncharacterized protein n=1 Tax=Vespula pensylvanica TaxID=30213 RepID=A0A834JZS7_VESPE|nr:hypothetical protein H0235_016732 [Vespula pensylvanica]
MTTMTTITFLLTRGQRDFSEHTIRVVLSHGEVDYDRTISYARKIVLAQTITMAFQSRIKTDPMEIKAT